MHWKFKTTNSLVLYFAKQVPKHVACGLKAAHKRWSSSLQGFPWGWKFMQERGRGEFNPCDCQSHCVSGTNTWGVNTTTAAETHDHDHIMISVGDVILQQH